MTDSFILVMPVYNEEGCIKKVIDDWMKIVRKVPGSEMVILNDGSKDNTGKILDTLDYKGLTVIHKENGGHGDTVYKGYDYAIKMTKHKYVFQTDSDDQFEPEDFWKLWERREESKFIIGFREKRNDPTHRLILTRIIRFFNTLFFGVEIKDANIPYRLMQKDYLKECMRLVPKTVFAPNIMLSIVAARDGQNLMSIPVTHRERETGTISIVKWGLIKSCMRGFKELWQFRFGPVSQVDGYKIKISR